MSSPIFKEIFQRVTSGEKFDFANKDLALSQELSGLFEYIATQFMAEIPARKGRWFDGVVGLKVQLRKPRQLEFTGEMWVGQGKLQWKEDFRARVTDKRITQQGVEFILWIGDDRVEGELTE